MTDIKVDGGAAWRRDDAPAAGEPEDGNNFFRCYDLIMAQSHEWVQSQLWRLGNWPYERLVIRVLDWEETVTRLHDDAQSMLAMTRMVVGIEDQDHRIYLVRTPDLVVGVRQVRQNLQETTVKTAIDRATGSH